MSMEVTSELKQQGSAVLVMMSLAIVSVLAIILLNVFSGVVDGLPGLGNGSIVGTTNHTVHATLTAFTVAFALFGSFASITALVILVKAIVGIVRGLQ